MSGWALVAGTAGLNACFLAVGYAVALPFFDGLDLRARASYAGVCLLLGASLIGVVLTMLAYTGTPIGLAAFAAVSGALVAGGLLARLLIPAEQRARLAPVTVPAEPERSFLGGLVTTVAAYGVFAISAIALVGGFRSSPWLDDSWGFWLPKGLALNSVGLDHRLFTSNGTVVPFANLDYPLWWSIVMNLDERFVGGIDMRAINVQLTVFELAFVATVGRLLWGRVRPWVLWSALLALIMAPELLREAQGGSADLPLALFLALFALSAAIWLAHRDRFALLLVFAFGAATVSTKLEAQAQALIVLVVVTAFGWRTGRGPKLMLWGVAILAFLTTTPWYLWRTRPDVGASVSGGELTSWSYLHERLFRIGKASRLLIEQALNPAHWALLIPLLVVVTLLGLLLESRPLWLGPLTGFVLLFAFWVFAFWTTPDDRITGSVYRVVMAVILPAAVFLPVLAEQVVARLYRRRAPT